MNTLVVYDSHYGNTERLARVNPDEPVAIEDADLLIIGSPTQGWRPTATIQSFLATLPSGDVRGVAVACFDTRFAGPRWLTGSAARMMAKTLQAMGAALLAPPESFVVTGRQGPLASGERDRAVTWARTVLAKLDMPQSVAR